MTVNKMNKEKLRKPDIFIKDLSSGRKVIIDVNYPRKNTKKIIRNIAKKIGDNYKPEKIILFGSYAYCKPKKDSDIDLLIIKKTKARHIERAIKVREIVKEWFNRGQKDMEDARFLPLRKITNFYFESMYPVGYEVE